MTHPPKIKRKVVVIDQDVVKSVAWLSLSGVAPQVYTLFLTKRRMEKMKRRGSKEYICTNNRELIFPYREAESNYKITQPRFLRAIDQLIDHGFIDIAKLGRPVAKEPTEYALSERWREYGKAGFQQKKRQKVKAGFCRTRKCQAK